MTNFIDLIPNSLHIFQLSLHFSGEHELLLQEAAATQENYNN